MKKIWKSFACILCAASLCAFTLAGCGSTETSSDTSTSAESSQADTAMTKAKYDQINTGMTYEEVVALIGSEGESMSESEIMGIKTALYCWYGADKISNATITFQDGKVTSKSQISLQ